MTDFQTIKSILVGLAPIAIPYAISTFRKYRSYARTQRAHRKPVPRGVGFALNILFLTAIVSLAASFYAFSNENVITDTDSRLQTPQNVLWERVAARRPGRELTELDEKLRDRLASTDGRCLYLMYGGDTVGNCPFCNSDEPRSFFYYAIPEIFLPHMLNMGVLGLATSDKVAGREGSRFRVLATVIGVLLVLIELTAYEKYDWKANARAARASKLFHFYGWARLVRSVGFAVVDMGFAAFLWATATNRLMVVPSSATERLDRVLKMLEIGSGKLAATGIVRNAAARDELLNRRGEEWFRRDAEGWKEIMKEEDVQKSIRKAQGQGRLDTGKIEREAEKYAENLIPASGAETGSSVT